MTAGTQENSITGNRELNSLGIMDFLLNKREVFKKCFNIVQSSEYEA